MVAHMHQATMYPIHISYHVSYYVSYQAWSYLQPELQIKSKCLGLDVM